MKLNHCHSVECAQIVEALTAKANAYMEMMDANAKELDRLMAERKPWVGLTRDEVLDIEEETTHPLEFYRAIEAKLKEKNT